MLGEPGGEAAGVPAAAATPGASLHNLQGTATRERQTNILDVYYHTALRREPWMSPLHKMMSAAAADTSHTNSDKAEALLSPSSPTKSQRSAPTMQTNTGAGRSPTELAVAALRAGVCASSTACCCQP
jgi:hypothetical protein